METRREFLRKASLLSGGAGLLNILPSSIAKALAINPAEGSSYLDAEHIVFLMQENRSFDHTYGTLQGVRGFNDPRAITLPNNNPVWLQTNKGGETFAPFRLDIKNTNATWMESLPHTWPDQVDARNNGRYDKWLDAKGSHVEQYKGMPLTLGFYMREDIPFYYSLADAFTVCDHNFCSSLTGTTPNRLFFWTGTIRGDADENSLARVWNSDADYDSPVNWTTFPERLQENGITWKIYQNEIGVNSGLNAEQEEWLGNFGDNTMEYFSQFKVNSKPEELSEKEKNLHTRAFTTNRKDPNYHDLSCLKYNDGKTERELDVPKGDVLFQFREDVNNGTLPTVSWLVASQKFSDHPSTAWFGAWYISEVMDILTKNPEVWKKTIFILTYDENDGYFDHVPPFVAPDPHKPGTGMVSKGIDTSTEYVSSARQQSSGDADIRTSPVGLGYRVPLVIASPWSRGGWVNSQVFDHTSSLQFLEKFLSNKSRKKIEEPNISRWRRTVCGDLTSVFRPYNGESIDKPAFLERDDFIESIHKAKFMNAPSNFKKVSGEQIQALKKEPSAANILPSQEKGIRDANALPYELYVDGHVSADKKTFRIRMHAGNKVFGTESAGGAFNIYAPGTFKGEQASAWSYAVLPGDNLRDNWNISDFENGIYHLRVYGPNGFYREFTGSADDPSAEIYCQYEKLPFDNNLLSGNILVEIKNAGSGQIELELHDNSYKSAKKLIMLSSGKNNISKLALNLSRQHGWYDFSIKLRGSDQFEKRFAGRVENGKHGKTDPLMGGIV